MRSSAVLLALFLGACASRPPAATREGKALAQAPDAGEPRPARSSADAGPAALGAEISPAGAEGTGGAGPAAEGWLAFPASTPALAAELAREGAPLRSFEFSSPDGRYRGQVLASAAPRVDAAKAGGVPILRVPIGAALTVDCALHDGRVHPAARLHQLLANLEKKRSVSAVGAALLRVAGDAPLLFVDVLHEAPREAGSASAQAAGAASAPTAPSGRTGPSELKIAFAARPSASLICTHDGAGYRRAFEQVVESVAASITDSQARKASGPVFSELGAIRAGGQLVGYRFFRAFAPRPDGMREEITEAARIERDGKGALVASDLEGTELRAPGGELRHASYLLSRDGAWSRVALEEEPEGSYAVHGNAGDQPLSGMVKSSNGLRRPRSAELLAVASGERAELAFDDYSPLAPLELKELRVRRGDEPRTLFVSDTGAQAQRWTLDERGEPSAILKQRSGGGIETLERLWSQGAP